MRAVYNIEVAGADLLFAVVDGATGGEEHEGAAVYRNSDGYILYRYSDGTWRASQHGIGWFSVISSVDRTQCPASIRQWQYCDYPDWQFGDITAKCSVHTW